MGSCFVGVVHGNSFVVEWKVYKWWQLLLKRDGCLKIGKWMSPIIVPMMFGWLYTISRIQSIFNLDIEGRPTIYSSWGHAMLVFRWFEFLVIVITLESFVSLHLMFEYEKKVNFIPVALWWGYTHTDDGWCGLFLIVLKSRYGVCHLFSLFFFGFFNKIISKVFSAVN